MLAIAGAGGNLGPTVVHRLAHVTGRLCLCGRDRTSLEPLAAESPDTIDTDELDLLDAGATKAWAGDLVRRHGRVDGLIHLVGGWRGGMPIEESPPEDWKLLHDLLVGTLQTTTQAFAKPLMESGHGRFVIVSTGQAQAPTHTNAAYAAAKAAAEAWTLALADGFTGTGATANIVVVEAILTPLMREASPGKEFPTFTPAEHVAAAIEFICSAGAAEMNGQRIPLTMR